MTSGSLLQPFLFQYSGKSPPLSTLATLQNMSSSSKSLTNRVTFSYGTGSGQIDTIIANAYELAASATANHNFFDGSIPDVFGAANGLQNIKSLAVYLVANTDGSTAASSVTIGNAATPLTMNMGGTATYQLFSGQVTPCWGKPAGFSVTNLLKLLKIVNDDATNKATYWILAGGVKV